jgi:hypothetical protein
MDEVHAAMRMALTAETAEASATRAMHEKRKASRKETLKKKKPH